MSTRTFRDWSQSRPLAESLARAEAQVRARPQDANERWLLFELLCVLAQWDRALVQLRSWAGLASHPGSVADVMRGLIMAERQRGEVFSGRGRPAPMSVGDEATCEWMTAMGRALKLAAGKDAAALEASDAVRESALAQATETPGSSNLQPAFAWISDSDSRLGPVCEVMVGGTYRWLAFADLAAVEKDAPSSLLDLVWSNAAVRLRDGTVLDCHLPMRYPVHADDRDALRLGRETVWAEIGRTGVFARGQKTWTSDLGDMPLFDLRRCIFGTEPGNGAQTASAEGEGHAEH
ncbi:hypothetical protein RD110_14715 [Rhodoferax koreense]|uniref:Virulence protein SciE type n=2 Tax=Rhodoferax koreensis TaxID=1842727 RepID=A0A1P8K3X3_9BURK|nr:hypothetical protein RD110_14715 [Rhodoferax koreense]